MRATAELHDLGQSIWLDNITREMLDSGQLSRFIDNYSVTGLTSNPSIFQKAISSGDYDAAIEARAKAGREGEDLLFDVIIADLRRAADLFLGVHARTDHLDGFVSLEVSPELAYDTGATVDAARRLHAQANRPNVLIKIPGTTEGLPAIEETIYAGIPVNVTLLFDAEQLSAAYEAYLRGIERRVAEGLNPSVASVASLFMSRWDAAVADTVPVELTDKLALAVGGKAYRAYRQINDSQRVQRLLGHGARVQRLLWASTSTKNPDARDTLYVEGLAAPLTVNTMPSTTLEAFYDHGEMGAPMSPDGGDCDVVLGDFAKAGIDAANLAMTLQSDGAKSFVDAWSKLREQVEATAKAVS